MAMPTRALPAIAIAPADKRFMTAVSGLTATGACVIELVSGERSDVCIQLLEAASFDIPLDDGARGSVKRDAIHVIHMDTVLDHVIARLALHPVPERTHVTHGRGSSG